MPDFLSRLRGRTRRRSLSFTREGKIFVLFCTGVGFAALNTNNNMLYLSFCLMLALIVVSGLLSEGVISRTRVSRILPQRARAGQLFMAELTLTNTSRFFPVMAVELRDIIEGQRFRRSCFFLRVAPGESRSISYRCQLEHRGHVSFDGVEISTAFPFGLFRKSSVVSLQDTLLAWPVMLETGEVSIEQSATAQGTSRLMAGHGQEFFQLRNFETRDDPRMISWKATAKAGRPIIKETVTEHQKFVHLFLDAASQDLSPEQAEYRISQAATLVDEFNSKHYEVQLTTNQASSLFCDAIDHPDLLLDHLALLSTSEYGTQNQVNPESFRGININRLPAPAASREVGG